MKREGVRQGGSTSIGRANPEAGDESTHCKPAWTPEAEKTYCLG